jgi:predicted flap endonuclease-1-like 5' DNA nuclease
MEAIMGTTIPGGRYRDARGQLVNAQGQPLDESVKAAEPAPAAASDDLTAIVGIGPTMQERLNEAGIYSYSELVTAEMDHISSATRANQSIIKAWRTDALALYEAQQQQTAASDDLTLIAGIGPTRARELALKNITSYRALAQADPEWLHATMEVSRTMIDQWQSEAGRLARGDS